LVEHGQSDRVERSGVPVEQQPRVAYRIGYAASAGSYTPLADGRRVLAKVAEHTASTPTTCAHRLRPSAPPEATMEAIALEPLEALTVTTLVDELLVDEGPAKRPPRATSCRVPVRVLEGGDADDGLRAEHGFSALVTITKGNRETRVLFDPGGTPDGMVETCAGWTSPRVTSTSLCSVTGTGSTPRGWTDWSRSWDVANVRVLIHPEFWRRRGVALPGRDPIHLPTTSRRALLEAGFEIVEER
jgi:7,8-dihydropterin-6-yl-methyl-4-(beta-D-ribofuranosyl)aminobenzene 5'-phosphate synthase